MRLLPYGPHALLIELDAADQVLPVAAALADDTHLVDVVPGARTVLVRAAEAVTPALREHVASAVAGAGTHPPVVARRPTLTLPVVYDGADLEDVAAEIGTDVADVVRRHCAGEYVVAFCGFAPGFAYLRGLDVGLHVGRLAEPRTRVPTGSVGIAGEFTGVYPRSSPGGWRLLGHTDTPLWDVSAQPPALLDPGTHVRFRPA